MQPTTSDTTLIARLKAGRDGDAVQQIWQRYFERLASLARARLQKNHRRARDEEDVALSALDSFFRGVEKGRFPRLDDSDDLWQILVLLAQRKAVNHLRRERAAKRGGGQVQGDSYLHAAGAEKGEGLEQIEDAEPTPALAAIVNDQCRRLFDALDDPELRIVALLKMEGFTNDEIARSLDRVPRSVERKLQAIRKMWRSHTTDG